MCALSKKLTQFAVPALAISMMLLSACVSSRASTYYTPTHYRETHNLQRLQVVLLDEQSLSETYETQYGRQATRITMKAGLPSSISRVKAFYDFQTHTIYCVKWDFENCGHELHHALLGRFHAEHG